MLAKPERVAKTELEALTNRGYDRDSSGQKDVLHSLRHLPVEVIDVLWGTGIFSVIVVSAGRQSGRNTQVRHIKMRESEHIVGPSEHRTFVRSFRNGNEHAWRCHRSLFPSTKSRNAMGRMQGRERYEVNGGDQWRKEGG